MIRRVIIAGILWVLIVPVCAISFFGSNTLPVSADKQDVLIQNEYILKDSLPPEVYNYAMTRIQRYHDEQVTRADAYNIQNNELGRSDGKYSITLEPVNGRGDDLIVDIRVDNYGNFFSISVVINGKVQSIS